MFVTLRTTTVDDRFQLQCRLQPSHQMSKTHDLEPGQSLFLSVLDVPGGWLSARIELSHSKRFVPSPPDQVDISLIHDQFVDDMREFAIL
jgi:hypothetical protein